MVATFRVFAAIARRLTLAAALGLASTAWADKVHLKDGTAIEGVVVRETDAFIQIKVKVGGLESVKTLLRADIKKIEKDTPSPAATPAPATAPAPAADASKPDAAKPTPGDPNPTPPPTPAPAPKLDKAAARAERLNTSGTRVAILNFGAPSSWNSEIDSTVGIQILASSWMSVIPLLEKDKIDVVVVRINSGGGSDEFLKFQDLFHDVYKKKFRTVGWVESAISAAAMAPYTLEEFYFMPNASYGACVGWSGDLQNMEGAELEIILAKMEDASRRGKRAPVIMRAMQLQVPLTATIDEKTGEVTWFGDTSGQHMINRPGQILTFTANDAVKFKFARAIAATKEQLAAAMGIKEVVWAGEEASRKIDSDMRAADNTEKRWQLKYREYQVNAGYAEQAQDRTDRGKFAGRALSALRELRGLFKANPGVARQYGIDNDWFEVREQAMKKLLAGR